MAAGAAFIICLTFATYLPAIRGGFIWDDDQHIVQNALLHDGAGLLRIWLDPRASQQYYPLVHSSFWLEFQLWGLDARGFHRTQHLLIVRPRRARQMGVVTPGASASASRR